MEKINIAELLKDCPKGMELDCTMFYNVKFDHVDASGDYPIVVTIGEERNYNYLTEYGEWNGNDMAKCVIYPKGKTTWEGFVPPHKFKDGDRVKSIYNNNQYDIIGLTDTHYTLVEVENKFKYTEPIIEDKNWELVPKKFDITTLKPFDKVLARDNGGTNWLIDFFEIACTDGCICYKGHWKMCIPYEGNEHLHNTVNDCDDFYKTWE